MSDGTRQTLADVVKATTANGGSKEFIRRLWLRLFDGSPRLPRCIAAFGRVWIHSPTVGPGVREFTPTVDDLLADDWTVWCDR